MASKLPTIALYLCIGFIIVYLLARNLLAEGTVRPPAPRRRAAAVVALLIAIVFLQFSSPAPGLLVIGCAIASALICPVSRKMMPRRIDWPAAAMLFMVFCLAATLAWWRRSSSVFDISWQELLILQLLLVAGTWALAVERDGDGSDRRIWWFAFAAFIFGGFLFLFSTGLYGQPRMLWLSWHHWGAYIGPAQLMHAGVRLFHDAPAQYGLGPTALLALSCGANCWSAMYFVVGISSLLYGVLLMSIAVRVSGSRQTPLQVMLIALVTFASVFVWTSYPPNLGSPALTPSVSGLRFLPLALLMWALIRGNDGMRGEKPSEAIHMLWLLGVLWSPESAFQVTVVWWPYYVWSRGARADGLHRLRTFLLANARLTSWLIAGVASFLLIYRLAYGVMPTLDGYLAYAMYPPGPLPVDLSGAVWFFGAVIVLGIVGLYGQLRTSPDVRSTHNIIVLLLAAYGASSYFLGRSHDNNLLNISVFFALLLLALREVRQGTLLRIASCGLLAALLVYPSLAGWNSWADVVKTRLLVEFQPDRATARFSYMHARGMQANIKANQLIAGPQPPEAMTGDAARGMRTLWEQFHEPVTVLDPAFTLEGSSAGAPWSAFHGPENYVYLPPRLRRQFLAKVAARLNAPGWLLIRRDYPVADWLSDYDEVYRRDRTLDFGTYYAIRYVPLDKAHK
ncbi:hypothetical protein [Dyella sp. Tek66A03]|uniref:hypothetical protein n=1 Tax=Dyella sp. Tek66A03 TaxID=3458298 RepID=UPI00403E9615